MNDRVRLRIADGLATVTLNRPDKHNGIDFEMIDAVLGTIRTLGRTPDVRAAIVHGDGPSFCAGLDFKSVFAKPVKAALGFTALWSPVRNKFQEWSMGWRELPFPVIAAVHGNCFGGGIQLALGADIRFAAPDAKISVMESKWGLVPDMGGAALLRELVGIDVAKELCFTSRILSGTEAHSLRLVTYVADDPLAAAKGLAAEIMTRSPDAVASAKFLLQRAWNSGESATLAQERRYQRRLLGSRNQRISVERNMKKSDQPFATRRVSR
ncbi:MAG TPA: crotonase/enoyl-CoA hydratase family protein [Rudaea sp.]|nr:crotonase/enoyl-CoA hydratase family protein [Rudaea sp.]